MVNIIENMKTKQSHKASLLMPLQACHYYVNFDKNPWKATLPDISVEKYEKNNSLNSILNLFKI